MIFQRVAAIFGITVCVLAAIFYIPRTPYGAYLTGNYYFSKYLQSGSEKEADKAFALWQNGESKTGFADAFDRIPQSSKLWKTFIKRSSSLYQDTENPQYYLHYLESLKQKLTHPMGKSAFYFVMGERYMDQLPENALEYFNTVIQLDVDPVDISIARGNIHEIENLKVGQVAPDFVVRSLEGMEYSRDRLQGNIVLLDFWSMHCGGCLKEIPTIKKLYKRFTTDNFVLLTISLEDGKEVTDFIAEQQIPGFHILIDRDKKAEILRQFNIQYIPATYVLDKEGKIAYKRLRGRKLEDGVASLVGHE